MAPFSYMSPTNEKEGHDAPLFSQAAYMAVNNKRNFRFAL